MAIQTLDVAANLAKIMIFEGAVTMEIPTMSVSYAHIQILGNTIFHLQITRHNKTV